MISKKSSAIPVVLLALIGLSCCFPKSASAQSSYQGTLEVSPLPQQAPEVKSFQDRVSRGAPKTLQATRSDVPRDVFLAVIDPDAVSGAAKSKARSMGISAKRTREDAAQRTIFDEANKTWFDTEYGPPLNVSLYCSWRFDPALEAAAKAAQEERDREPVPEGGAKQLRDTIPPQDIVSDEEKAARPEVIEGEDGEADYGEVRYVFSFAGATCTLTKLCEEGDANNCTEDFLKSLSELVVIAQMGDRQ